MHTRGHFIVSVITLAVLVNLICIIEFNKKITILILPFFILILIGLFSVHRFNLLGDCHKNIINTISSENKQIEISIINCGATTDLSTHIALNDLLDNTHDEVVVLKGDHTTDLSVFWTALNEVNINYNGRVEDSFNFQSKIRDINFQINAF